MKRIKESFFITLILSIILVSHTIADEWMLPERSEVYSANKKYMFVMTPRPIQDQSNLMGHDQNTECTGEVYVLVGMKDYELRHKFKLDNRIAPISMAISDSGNYIATTDNWGRVGYGDNVVVIYDGKGNILYKYSLEDILTQKEMEEFTYTSVSSRWWVCKDPKKCVPLNINEKKGRLEIDTKAGMKYILLKDGTVTSGRR